LTKIIYFVKLKSRYLSERSKINNKFCKGKPCKKLDLEAAEVIYDNVIKKTPEENPNTTTSQAIVATARWLGADVTVTEEVAEMKKNMAKASNKITAETAATISILKEKIKRLEQQMQTREENSQRVIANNSKKSEKADLIGKIFSA
jgi:hypothetical protein